MAQQWTLVAIPSGGDLANAAAIGPLLGRARALLSLADSRDQQWTIMSGGSGDDMASSALLTAALRRAAGAAPERVALQLGGLICRPSSLGQQELCLEVQLSAELLALREHVRSAVAGPGGKENQSSVTVHETVQPHVLLGTYGNGPANARGLARLEGWWASNRPAPAESGGIAVVGVALADAKGASIARTSLGRAAAIARGLSILDAKAPPPAAPLCRARSDACNAACGATAGALLPAPRLGRSASSDALKGVGGAPAPARARCVALEEDVWAVSLTLGADHPARLQKPDSRFHFVLDNSGSMGRNTASARDCFSELLSVASGPCSLTVFANEATTIGEAFMTPAAMRAATLPRQGQTNISEGIQNAVDIIIRCEREAAGRAHHVLVLLSDGQHNRGPHPTEHLPEIGAALRAAAPAVRLSVVVVGITANSSTSMGMLLKQSLETVPLPSLQPIYFATSMQGMQDALGEMHDGLTSLQGSFVRVSALGGCCNGEPQECGLVRAVGEAPAAALDLPARDGSFPLLCIGAAPPAALLVDGEMVGVTPPPASGPDAFDSNLVAEALQALMDGVRQRRIACGEASVRSALEQLGRWTAAMERRLEEQRSAKGAEGGMHLARAGPQSRLAQHKAAVRCLHGARELRNQLAEIEALRASDSASQAAFLNGAKSKYGAKALRRGARCAELAGSSGDQFQALLLDVQQVGAKMKKALREDLCAKLAALSEQSRQRLRQRLGAELPFSVPRAALDALCFGGSGAGATAAEVEADAQLAQLADSGEVVRHLLETAGGARRSFISLQSAWEHLREWCDAAQDAARHCATEYELLMYLGATGLPIDAQRRAATQMNPYAMDVSRVRTAPADSGSLCCALKSGHAVVPPEGGVAVEDLLVLVDPDWPRASRLACRSKLLGEVYTSVVLCRDLHMFTGKAMTIALHAHALMAAVQCAPPVMTDGDVVAQLRRRFLNRAYQCRQCGFGPIDHFACGDLQSHHGEVVDPGVQIDNSCPRCGWFAECIADWPMWDGTVPATAKPGAAEPAATGPTAASVEAALRICYSARALWRPDDEGEAHELCGRLAAWGEPLTAADGVDHPIKLLLALAMCDTVSPDALATPAVVALLSEVCARQARDELCMRAGSQEQPVVMAAARRLVAGFLGVTAASAPCTRPLEEAEPPRRAVTEECCSDYELDASSFDFVSWVKVALRPWLAALLFVRRLREHGGWQQLQCDLEAGPSAYEDLASALCAAPGEHATLEAWLGVDAREVPRVCAAMAAQAFLHNCSQQRRTAESGGSLEEPLGDVRAGETLRGLAVELRMATYSERVAAKMQEWSRVGSDMTFATARAADIGQYSSLLGSHAHGMDKQKFWGLWRAAKADGFGGAKVKDFLSRANRDFVNKHGRR